MKEGGAGPRNWVCLPLCRSSPPPSGGWLNPIHHLTYPLQHPALPHPITIQLWATFRPPFWTEHPHKFTSVGMLTLLAWVHLSQLVPGKGVWFSHLVQIRHCSWSLLRNSKVEFHWCLQLSPHQQCRRASSGVVDCWTVGQEDEGEVHVPVTLMFCNKVGELLGQSSIKLLHQAFAVGVKWSGVGILHS